MPSVAGYEREKRGLDIRPATAADGGPLVELTRMCPMQGDVSLRIDRAPDFFALSRCRGDGYTLIAERGDRIVGCVSVARRLVYVGAEPTPAGYVGDVKIHPAERRAGLARRLLREVERQESSAPPAYYAGTTAAGNTAVDRLLFRFGQECPVPRVGAFASYQLFPILRSRPTRDFEIACAREDDEQELAALLDAAHRKYLFGPIFSGGGLRELLARSPGMTLQDYLVARRAGRMVAALGSWDQSSFKQTWVLRLPRTLRWLSSAMRAGAPRGLPALPREGEPLRFRYARHAAGEPAAVNALVRHALAESRRRRDHFLLFTCAEGDPITRSLSGIPRTTYRYNLVIGRNTRASVRELEQLSASLPYDDAALA